METDSPLEAYKQAVEDMKYSHSLSRTLWVALLGVLLTLYGVKFGLSAP